jgi:DNA-binding GntR family transcriptional regulator
MSAGKLFNKIRLASTKDRAVEMIRGAILEGKLAPGERITELQLSKEMDVSQGVVREALQELEFQGLVVRIPKHGTFVTDYSVEDIKEIYQFRMECEGLAAELAKQNGRPNNTDFQDLQSAIDEMQAGADRGDFLQFSRSDLRFHEHIWQMSGNRYLEKALRVVATPQFAYVLIRSFRHTGLDLPAIVNQHREIVEKLRTGSPEECRKFLREMTQDFLNQIVKNVAELEKSSAERSSKGF